MARTRTLTRDEVLRLRRAAVSRADGADQAVRGALERPLGSTAAIKELHDLLLFLEAYPTSAEQHRIAVTGMRRFRQRLHERITDDARLREALQDSGLAGGDVVGSYSYTMVRWLLKHWPAPVLLHDLDASAEQLSLLVRPLLTPPEQEALDQCGGDAAELLAALFGAGGQAQLKGLVQALAGGGMGQGQREALFNALSCYVRIVGSPKAPSLSTLRFVAEAPSFHPGPLQRSVDVPALLARPVEPPLPLTAGAHRRLIATARQVLALMQRETDPVTYAQRAELHAMGRGLTIALFHMDPAHRLSLESYVGFMAFKNGVPMAYGGAWVFPGRTKVGINVFPALRGGESAWFFAQLLRLYHQRFSVPLFEAENYQLGHGNPDGLRSGAYWFYYRLGFRPWNERLARIAAREAKRLGSQPGYEVPLPLLKELVADGLVLRIRDDEGQPMVDTAALVHAAGALAGAAGDRPRALRDARARARRMLGVPDAAAKRAALEDWALPLALIDDLERWPVADRRCIARALALRSAGTEHGYQEALRRCTRLLHAWAEAGGQG